MDGSDLRNAMYQTASMGTESIKQVMPKVSSKSLRNELAHQMNNYHEERSEIVSQMRRNRMNPTPLPPGQRFMSKAGIALDLARDSDNAHIAEMMIKGTNMGIIKINKALNNSGGIPAGTVRQAKAMLEKEQDYIEHLKKFL